MMYSYHNPIPDLLDNAGMTDPDSKLNVADLIINDNDARPIYLAVSAWDYSKNISCDHIELDTYALGEKIKRIYPDESLQDNLTG